LHAHAHTHTHAQGQSDSEGQSNEDKKKFSVRHTAKGVTVGEKSAQVQVLDLPMEMLCATVSTKAAPSVVRRLLRESPRAVDNMLEGHRVLLTLPPSDEATSASTATTSSGGGAPPSPSASSAASKADTSLGGGLSTYVQHLQYGTIWPVGARDYLLVTSEEDFYSGGSSSGGYSGSSGSEQAQKKPGASASASASASDADIDRRGFIFASTSIDHLWSPESAATGSSTDDSSSSSSGMAGMLALEDNADYSRSTLRLAGYVGEANAAGGTDLTMYVDLGMAAYIPSWMLQMLANYGLSEMMRRIRHAADKAAAMIAQEEAERAAAAGGAGSACGSEGPAMKASSSSGSGSGSAATRARSRTRIQRDGRASPSPGGGKGRGRGMSLRTAGGSPVEDINGAGDFFDDDGESDEDEDEDEDEEEEDMVEPRFRSKLMHSFTSQHKEGGGPRQSMRSLQSPAKRGSLGSWSAVDSVEGDGFVELAQEAYNTIQQYLSITERTAGSSLPSCMKKHAKFLLTNAGERNVPVQPAGAPLALQWADKGGKAGIKVHNTKVPGSDWCAIKATVTLPADKHDIRKLLTDDARCGEYDDMYDKFTLLRTVDERTSVRLVQMKGIWPTAAREFVLLSSWAELADGSLLIFSKSPDAEDIAQICDPVLCAMNAAAAAATASGSSPAGAGGAHGGPLDASAAAVLSKASKGYVRGCIVTSGYLIEPIAVGDNGAGAGAGAHTACKVTLVAHTELGGSLPSSIINSLATGAPVKLLQGVAAVLSRRR